MFSGGFGCGNRGALAGLEFTFLPVWEARKGKLAEVVRAAVSCGVGAPSAVQDQKVQARNGSPCQHFPPGTGKPPKYSL